MIEFTDLDYDNRIQNGVVLVEVGASWCGPCRMLKPILEDVSNDYVGKVTFGEIDVDKCPDTATKLQVRNVPTILLYKNGSVVEKQVGLVDKSKLKSLIDKHLN